MRKLLFAAILPLALMGNGGSCGRTHVVSPGEMYLHCAAEPDVPGDPETGVVSDEQDAQYKRDLRGSGQDCRSKVDYLRDWFAKLPH